MVFGVVRQLAVVENLVLEVAELLDDLLALGNLLGIVHLGDGAVDIVNGLGKDDGPSVADRVVGEGRDVRGHGLG